MGHEYTVGETVYILDHMDSPMKRTKVKEIKRFKRGPKVICEDGTEWDVEAGRVWGQRAQSFYTGESLEPHSDKVEARFQALITKKMVKWTLDHFDALSVDEQDALQTLIAPIQRAHKNKATKR